MATPSFVADVLRPLDLLVLRFEFYNLVLEVGASPPRLVRESPTEKAFVVVQFPPQHVAEPGTSGDLQAADFPLRGGLSAPTRLAFTVPQRMAHIAFTLAELLKWSRWEPSVVPSAVAPDATFSDPPTLRKPGTGTDGTVPETAIELPYRLILSPHHGAAWAHSVQPASHQDRTELWHTRLAVAGPAAAADERDRTGRVVRAVWTRDRELADPGFPNALQHTERDQIVRASADFNGRTAEGHPYQPVPVVVDQLMLSALGGCLRARGQWVPPVGVDLTQWQHVATQGRDHYVRTDRVGFLYPFGHRAVITTITERTFVDVADHGRQAVLQTRAFLTVQDAVRRYEAAPYPHGGREMPLTEVRVATLTMTVERSQAESSGEWFWVHDDRRELALFHLVGQDQAGADIAFDAALIFVPKEVLDDSPERLHDVQAAYVADGGAPMRRVAAGGQPMAFAPPRDRSSPGDTSLITEELFFDGRVDVGEAGSGTSAPFLPLLEAAKVRVPALQQIVATPGANQATAIVLAQTYLDHGLDAAAGNAAQLFAEIKTAIPVEFSRQGAGALVTPSFVAKGLSRHLGPVAGDLTRLAEGQFSPGDFFASASTSFPATLLGAVPLAKLVAARFEESQFPKIIRRVVGTSIVATLDWQPRLSENPEDLEPLRSRGPGISLTLRSEARQPLDGGPAMSTTTTTLRNFVFHFGSVAGADVLSVHFDSLAFTSELGRKPDVSAVLAPPGFEFGGPLAFLNDLRRFIPLDGFHDPPALDVTSAGINVGYTLGLPPLAVGVFALQNVRLGAALNLPFSEGKARLRFAFSERHEPFLLTVSGLGGGGFFGLAVGLDGIEVIEAALEFGAAAALNLGVASGGVVIMAGIYFKYVVETSETELTGYLRCGGALRVLGLISVSVEFYMALSYMSGPDRVEGQATLTVKISVLLFSKSVHLTVRRSFANAAGGAAIAAGDDHQLEGRSDRAGNSVVFGDLVTKEDWTDYAEAFA